MSSCDLNATNQRIAIERYESYFRKLDKSLSGKQQGAVRTEQKNYYFLPKIFG